MYWRPEPKRHGFAWWALLVPTIIYSVGVVVYAHSAFVPGAIHKNGHEIGSALMVLGGEAGTLMAAAEVFRKSRTGDTNPFDWIGLVVSLVATLGNLFVVYTALATINFTWVAMARAYGPLALLLCSGLDFYANVMEFGFYNASFDKRWQEWNDDRHAWEARRETSRKAEQEPAQDTQDQIAPVVVAVASDRPTTKAQAIRELARTRPDLSQAQIALAVGCAESHVSRVLRK